MIFATSLLLGVTAAQQRSAGAVIIIAALIAAVFFAAKLLSGGTVPYSGFGWSILGYNAGLAGVFVLALLPKSTQTQK